MGKRRLGQKVKQKNVNWDNMLKRKKRQQEIMLKCNKCHLGQNVEKVKTSSGKTLNGKNAGWDKR
jgi:hypothetical protein